MKLKPVTLAALAVVFATPALAQDAEESANESIGATADIRGYWVFDAYPTYPTCGLSGEVTFWETLQRGVYECELVATDVCPGVWSYTAEQTCTAVRDGDSLVIQSTIDRIEPPTGNYLPDNFVLTIVNGSLMVGELRSAVNAKAQFYRGDGPIS